MDRLVFVPVLVSGEKKAARMAVVFNGKELPLAAKITINTPAEGGTTVTVVWHLSEDKHGIFKIETLSRISEEGIKTLI